MARSIRRGALASRARACTAGDACRGRARRHTECGRCRTATAGSRTSWARDTASRRPRRIAGRCNPGARRRDPRRGAGAATGTRCRPGSRLMPKMTFIERDGTRREVDAPLGASVLQVARRYDIDIEGACEGSLACSTCHVIVDPEWYDLLKEASEDEDDMLDLAFNLTKTSRLGCQIIITEELDGLTVRLPAATSNFLFG